MYILLPESEANVHVPKEQLSWGSDPQPDLPRYEKYTSHPSMFRHQWVRSILFFSSHFFLASGLVATVLLGSFQACAGYTPAAPDMWGDGAKSKPLLIRCGL